MWCHVVGWVLRRSGPLDSEDEGITFLRGVPNRSLNDTASQPRRLNPQPHHLENLIPGIKRAILAQALVINIEKLKRNISNKIFICIQVNILNGAGKSSSVLRVSDRKSFICNAHAPYCSLRSSPLCNIFAHYLINDTIIKKKNYWTLNVSFDFLHKVFLRHFSFYV